MALFPVLCALLSLAVLAFAVPPTCSSVSGSSPVVGGADVVCTSAVICPGLDTAPGYHTSLQTVNGQQISTIKNTAFSPAEHDYYKITAKVGTTDDLVLVLACTGALGSVVEFNVGGQSVTATCNPTGAASTAQSLPITIGDETLDVVGIAGTPSAYLIQICDSTVGNDVKVIGDPHFVGFYNQKFDFQGHAQTSYNLYSDNMISLSTTFNSVPNKFGTFMTAFGLHLGTTTVTWHFDVSAEETAKWELAARKTSSFTPTFTSPLNVTINGSRNSLLKDESLRIGCAILTWTGSKLTLSYGSYTFTTILRSTPFGRKDPIRVPYFDLDTFSVPPQPRVLRQGGLLGFTLVPSWPHSEEDILEEAFTIPSLLSTDCQACKKPTSFSCVGTTAGRSASVAVTVPPTKA